MPPRYFQAYLKIIVHPKTIKDLSKDIPEKIQRVILKIATFPIKIGNYTFIT